MPKVTLLLVDDHPVVREGMRSFFMATENFSVVGEASDGLEAVRLAGALRPDIVLLDINMPRMNGLEAAAILRKNSPECKVLILTMHNTREYVLQIAKVGAHGYVLKDASPEELIDAITKVKSGRKFYSPEITAHLADYVESPAAPATRALSQRELEVLTWIAKGLSSKEIAGRTFLELSSVKTYRKRIMRKLQINSVAGLTHFAINQGLVSSQPN